MKKLMVTGILAVFLVSILAGLGSGSVLFPSETAFEKENYDSFGFQSEKVFQIPDWVLNAGNVGVLITFNINTNTISVNEGLVQTITPGGHISALSIDGITYGEYNAQIGNQKTTDTGGLDSFYVDNVKYSSQVTSINTITTNGFGWDSPSVADWKLWLSGDTYDDSTDPTNPYSFHIQVNQKKAGQTYKSNLIETGLRCKYNATADKTHKCNNAVKLFMPLNTFPRVSKVEIKTHLSSIKQVFEYDTIETYSIASESISILWGLFHYEYEVKIPVQIRDLSNVEVTREKSDLQNNAYFFNIV